MAFVLADLKRPSGKRNMGGLVTKAFYVPLDHVSFAEALVLSAAGKLDFAGPIVLAAGKKWIEIYATPNKNKIDDNTVGEIDSMSKENAYEFFHPGTEQAVDEFEAFALNTPCLICVPDTSGNKRVLGLFAPDPATTEISPDIACYLTQSNGTTGAGRADAKGKTFIFKSNAGHAPLYYTGALDIV